MSKFIDFYKTSSPSANKVAPEKATKYIHSRNVRIQSLLCMPHVPECGQRSYH